MDINLLLEARQAWEYGVRKDTDKDQECIALRKAIEKYEVFIRSLPSSITYEIEQKVVGACHR